MTEDWSYSKVNTFKECNRKFYFAYILANHSFKQPIRRKAYVLKNMQSLEMWQGTVVDKIMEELVIPTINDKSSLNLFNIADQAIEMAKRQFDFSSSGVYNQKDLTKTDSGHDFCILQVHELHLPHRAEDIEKVYESIRQSILNIDKIFMPGNSISLLDYLRTSNSLLPNITNWKLKLNNVNISPQIDLIAYQNWKPHVLDWKVSESEISDYSRQLLVIGLLVYFKRLEKQLLKEKSAYDYNDILLYEVNLLKKQIKNHPFTKDHVNIMVDYIYLTNSDIKLLFDHKRYDELKIDNIESTDNEAICKLCNFKTLCGHLLINNNNYEEKLYSESLQAYQFVGN